MSKRIVVGCDGSWDVVPQVEPDMLAPTNVAHAVLSLLPNDSEGRQQVVYYDNGAGLDRFGALAATALRAIGARVCDAYRFVVDAFEPGDQIFVFGFSRGAYTARCLVDLIRVCGVPRPEHRARAPEAYALSRWLADVPSSDHPDARGWRTRYAWDDHPRVRLLGLWDAVAPPRASRLVSWIPLGATLTSGLSYPTRRVWSVRGVDFVYHALAIDEQRSATTPSMCQLPPDAEPALLDQVWFAGTHGNLGGGHVDRGLSALPLRWMLIQARAAGLVYDPELVAPTHLGSNPLGAPRPPMVSRASQLLFGPRIRPIGQVPFGHESVHPSVLERLEADPSYRPPNLLAYLETGRQTARTPES